GSTARCRRRGTDRRDAPCGPCDRETVPPRGAHPRTRAACRPREPPALMVVSLDTPQRERLHPQARDLLELEERDTDATRRVDSPELGPTPVGELDVASLQPTLGNTALARALAPPPNQTE